MAEVLIDIKADGAQAERTFDSLERDLQNFQRFSERTARQTANTNIRQNQQVEGDLPTHPCLLYTSPSPRDS